MLRLFTVTLLAFVLSVLAILPLSPAQARLEIDITRGNFEPLPIAVPAFTSNDKELAQIGKQIAGVVSDDLARSGLFSIVERGAYIQQISHDTVVPRYADWRQINASGIVVGKINPSGVGKMQVQFRLFDNYAEAQTTGKQFNAVKDNWRRIAHLIADEIYKRITGEEGYFDTRIVYIAESGPEKNRTKRLAIMDQDGANHKFLSSGEHLVLTPRFSPNTQEILYLSYARGEPRVFLRDLETGREESLGHFRGMSFAPRFNHDGNKMVMSIARDGVTNIYEMDLRTRVMKRLTRSSAIDTSPSYSPDGERIVFTSDRGGSPQLYTMNADGSNVTRLSFGRGRYSTPVWSPRGDLIAFTKQRAGKFHIGLMRSDGSGERLLTESWLDEGPTWAPNGRVIIFTRQAGGGQKTRLYSIDVTGRNLRPVITPMEASDPAWSTLLPL